MVKHIVMFKLASNADGNSRDVNAGIMKERLEALQDKIPELFSIEVGLNIIDDPAGYDVVLSTAFQSKNDLMVYAGHQDHLEVVAFIKKVIEKRTAVDYITG